MDLYQTKLLTKRYFGKHHLVIPPDSLLEFQRQSYDNFIKKGIKDSFNDVFPISDYSDKELSLEFINYYLEEPKFTAERAREKDLNFNAALRVTLRLVNKRTGEKKDQEVYFGDIPILTETGTFIVNGNERAIVSQLIKSPGTIFTVGKNNAGENRIKAAITPHRGAWLEFNTENDGYISAKIDRKKKVMATIILKAFGVESNTEIKKIFSDVDNGALSFIDETLKKDYTADQNEALLEIYRKMKPGEPVAIDNATAYFTNLFKKFERYDLDKVGRFKMNQRLSNFNGYNQYIYKIKDQEGCVKNLKDYLRLQNNLLAKKDKENEDIIAELKNKANEEALAIHKEFPKRFLRNLSEKTFKDKRFSQPYSENYHNEEWKSAFNKYTECGDYKKILGEDVKKVFEEAMQIYKKEIKYLKPKEEKSLFYHFICWEKEQKNEDLLKKYEAEIKIIKRQLDYLERLIIDIEGKKISILSPWDVNTYNLEKYTTKIEESPDINQKDNRILRKEDIVATIHEMIRMNNDKSAIGDNIDHLGNRRIRSTGELLQNKFYIALTRLRRIIQDRMTSLDPSTLTPAQLINPRIITTAINQEFLNTSPLSQFMEQTNVLAELEHKRRLTGTGPGGIKLKAKSGVEIRDINSSHYGRICPINTPEGSNVGLVNELSCYARVNELGFVETPYFRVKNGKVTDELVWLNALDEEKYKITHACVNYDKTGKITDELVDARINANTLKISPKELDFIDVSSYQILSPASALIPFIERDETHRSLMGSIMQRQAVPCVKRDTPLVVTGLEEQVVKDSGQLILSKADGTVVEVDNRHIIIEDKEGKKHEYDLYSFTRTNQNTYLKQTPIVAKGQKIKKNQPLCDNSSSINGQLALGSNLTVAYMPWYGYTFEDAIIISEKLLKKDIFTSIYIEEFESEQRETKLGPEQTTNDIPNVSEKLLKDLDEEGIIRIGAEVKSGDILVGKVSPKGEIELTPEERLMQAIFGEEAKDVKNTSLTLPHGREGRIIRNRILARKSGDQLGVGVIKKVFVEVAELRKITVGDKLAGRHGNKGIISYIAPEEDMPFLADGTPVDIIINALSLPNRMNLGQIFEASLGLAAEKLNYQAVVPSFDNASEKEIVDEFIKANLPPEGKFNLFDGRTGEKFTQKVMVGKLYVMKLVHMVKDKIHARSVGPYALVTQQPLKGRAHFGGQRFGEMEVWALEAYGAAKALQEMLTIKSDDIISRREAYSSIIKGEDIKNPTVPAAFNVIVNELKSLCLNIETKMIKHEEVETQQ